MRTRNKWLLSSVTLATSLCVYFAGRRHHDFSQDFLRQTSPSLPYPSNKNPVHLKAGSKVTLKLDIPLLRGDPSNYMWYVQNDDHLLMAHAGRPIFENGSMYISLSVRDDITRSRDLQILLYSSISKGKKHFLDQKGIWISISPHAESVASDFDSLSEVCTSESAQAPRFTLDRKVASADALSTVDNGGGISVATCSFKTLDVDCFDTRTWPPDWATETLVVSATSRCGATTSVTLAP